MIKPKINIMNMYPLKFKDIFKSVIWGGNQIGKFKNKVVNQENVGESWEISQVKNHVSVVANGIEKGKTLTELIEEGGSGFMGRHVYDRFGKNFPLLIKFIDAKDDLSIQVHPDDKLAKVRHDSFGKTEMWYVINAEPGSGLYSGFSTRITPEEYVKRVEDNTIMDVLQFHPVKSGDVFFLPAGRIHAIGKGLLIAEIQQTSDITYRIYDYGRKDNNGNTRELHTQLAKDAIDYNLYDDLKTVYQPKENIPVKLVVCPYFSTNLLDITGEMKCDIASKDSFVIYICMEGRAEIEDNNGYKLSISQGETVLIPASLDWLVIKTDSSVKLLECFIPRN